MTSKTFCGDCLDFMATLPDECVDLTVTSPPYDGIRDYHGFSFDSEATIRELYRITKRGGGSRLDRQRSDGRRERKRNVIPASSVRHRVRFQSA